MIIPEVARATDLTTENVRDVLSATADIADKEGQEEVSKVLRTWLSANTLTEGQDALPLDYA